MRADRRTVVNNLEKHGEGSWRYLEEPSKDAKSSVSNGMVAEVKESGPSFNYCLGNSKSDSSRRAYAGRAAPPLPGGFIPR